MFFAEVPLILCKDKIFYISRCWKLVYIKIFV